MSAQAKASVKERREAERWYLDHVRPNERILLSMARTLLRSTDDAQDAFQDMLAYVMTEDRWRTITSPRNFLITAIRNQCINIMRARKVRPTAPWPDCEDMTFADQTPDVLAIITARERLREAEQALALLPPQCRKAFSLRRIDGLKPAKIAAELSCDPSTVRKHVLKGDQRLRAWMAQTNPESQ